jgi:energy-coupling factor transporter ATP-binding protein EcfA2
VHLVQGDGAAVLVDLQPAHRLVAAVVQELKASGATVLIATHQVERVAGYADCSITLDAGRVVATEGALL